jgi:hypothetical protein
VLKLRLRKGRIYVFCHLLTKGAEDGRRYWRFLLRVRPVWTAHFGIRRIVLCDATHEIGNYPQVDASTDNFETLGIGCLAALYFPIRTYMRGDDEDMT